MPSSRAKKQLIIGGLYLIGLIVVLGLLYWAFQPEPSCTDGIQNQNESGIDCGGVCGVCPEVIEVQDVVIQETAIVSGGQNNRYDVLAQIENPNDFYGVPELRYTFTLYNAAGAPVAQRTGEGFILPRQQRYFIETSIETGESPTRAEFAIDEIRWEEFEEYETPEIRVYNKRYQQLSSASEYAQATGLLRNESPFDLDTVGVYVVLRGENSQVLGMHTTEINTIHAGEERDFRLTWPSAFSGEVREVEMVPIVNVFESQNFIRIYLPEGRFQEYQ